MCVVMSTRHSLPHVCCYVTQHLSLCAVWEKIRGLKTKAMWLSTAEEEYEDREGNVFNRKTYEDLRRQGLL